MNGNIPSLQQQGVNRGAMNEREWPPRGARQMNPVSLNPGGDNEERIRNGPRSVRSSKSPVGAGCEQESCE